MIFNHIALAKRNKQIHTSPSSVRVNQVGLCCVSSSKLDMLASQAGKEQTIFHYHLHQATKQKKRFHYHRVSLLNLSAL
uniref:Uncharacterized protein n=1 Tax=Picea glauca TaxID=3330 RepID=A0A124GNP2_PICGL|nr:hypothetical protein ABT39_MTgene3967 [Picea glauca]